MDVKILTDLATKYKALLLENPEVFILVFVAGCSLSWFILRLVYHARLDTAKERLDFQKERVEHFRQRIEAAEVQLLRTFTPPKLDD